MKKAVNRTYYTNMPFKMVDPEGEPITYELCRSGGAYKRVNGSLRKVKGEELNAIHREFNKRAEENKNANN